jgi:hypothetical protein
MIERRLESIRGDIKEESPFIDDETNQPVLVEEKKDIQKESKEETKETEEATT